MDIADNNIFSEARHTGHVLYRLFVGHIHSFSSSAGVDLEAFIIDEKNISLHHLCLTVIHIQIFLHGAAAVEIVDQYLVFIVRLVALEDETNLSVVMERSQDLLVKIQTLNPLLLRTTERRSSTKYTEGATTPS